MKYIIAIMVTVAIFMTVIVNRTDDNVSIVKDSTIAGRPNVTIGKIIADTFPIGKWSSKTTTSGVTYTYFTSKIHKSLHDLAVQMWLKEYANLKLSRTDKPTSYTKKLCTEALQYIAHLNDQEKIAFLKPYRDNLRDSSSRNYTYNKYRYDAATLNMYFDLVNLRLWETGTDIQFKWEVNKDKKSCKLVNINSSSLYLFNTRISFILDVLYAGTKSLNKDFDLPRFEYTFIDTSVNRKLLVKWVKQLEPALVNLKSDDWSLSLYYDSAYAEFIAVASTIDGGAVIFTTNSRKIKDIAVECNSLNLASGTNHYNVPNSAVKFIVIEEPVNEITIEDILYNPSLVGEASPDMTRSGKMISTRVLVY